MRLTLALFVACALMAGPLLPARSVAAPVADADAQVTLAIEGMVCDSCAAAIKQTLKKLEGVKEADVSYPEKRARVRYEAGKVTPEKLVAAVNSLGYKARVEKKG